MSRGEPFFTVIIPTLNEEKLLPRLLESLLAQDFKNFEVLIVDGYSDDATVKKARRYGDHFRDYGVKFKIINSSRRNVSYQRNLGASRARGKYLCFLDADVKLKPNFFNLVGERVNAEDADLLGVFASRNLEDLSDKLIIVAVNLVIYLSVLIRQPFIPGFCFVVKREIFEETERFDEGIKVGEDYVLAKAIQDKGYRLAVLKRAGYKVSLRRYYSTGKIRAVARYSYWTIRTLLGGSKILKSDKINYPMGGHVHGG